MSLNRRQFIRNSSALLALTSLQAAGLHEWGYLPKRRVALIGTGWYGKSDLFRLMQVAPTEIVGLCDVDKHQLEEASQLIGTRLGSNKKIPLFGDYRKLLAEQKPEIVLIGSPDHWHAMQAIDSIKSGAHVYVQKPISVDVLEGEAMLAAARKYDRVVQVGTQRRSTPHLIEAKKNIVDAGLLGEIHHVEMCCYYHMRNNSNPPAQAVPDYLDYEMWTGPAPLRPYDGLPHRGWWRAFMEYGNGIMGDMCIHMFDAVRWMLGLGWPTSISSTGGIYLPNPGKSNIADTQTAVFAYDKLNCVWQHRTWGTASDPEYPWAFKIYGDKGTLCGSPMQYDFIPADNGKKIHRDTVYEREKYPEDLKEKDIELHAAPATRLHMLNFLDAINTHSRPVADIEQGHISTASCILANLSMKLGRPLRYDPVKKEVVGDAEATRLLQRPYRSPWVHPHPDTI
ncbi:Gfo/Idh/MocA family protein [Flavihumibacter profundi]|uniref:Gfo/Idh/MocA family protein n=1 Tax=Flavihumibacter profundi TaxID=2716883 RepID=UPI001CC5291A|nr:Gfo/Idh/MocA family oxidoreductase [Flavihumibacter profundi]MBZ5857410.1 Gfo/Idh/MocA family oxidoreductase [Flavihumibacter profundi]